MKNQKATAKDCSSPPSSSSDYPGTRNNLSWGDLSPPVLCRFVIVQEKRSEPLGGRNEDNGLGHRPDGESRLIRAVHLKVFH